MMPLLVPLTRVPHAIQQGVDAESSPHHKQILDRQSHTTTNITIIIIMIQMLSRVPIKTAISARLPQKQAANCCSVRRLHQQLGRRNRASCQAQTSELNKFICTIERYLVVNKAYIKINEIKQNEKP